MSFDSQPVLHGELLELRPLRAEDFDALFRVAADPLIWEQHPERDRCEEPTFRAFFEEAVRSKGALVAIDRASGEIIGSSRFHGYDADHSVVEIGWTFLARTYWGGRYNGEMKRLMLEHAFRWVNRVIFIIGPDNRRSQRAVEKIGGRRAGVTTDAHGSARFIYEMTPALFAGPQGAGRSAEDRTMSYTFEPIGFVRSPFSNTSEVPKGLGAEHRAEGVLEIATALEPGLVDIDGFSHLFVLWVFDRVDGVELTAWPPSDDRSHGVFATRSPLRPNPIGLTVVTLLGREGCRLRVAGVDMLDGTPILDLKPYLSSVPIAELRRGWLAEAETRTRRDRHTGDQETRSHGDFS